MDSRDREIAHWRAWQDRADSLWGWQTPAGMRRAARRSLLFRELGRMGPHSTVLELGCGTGEFSVRIAPHVKELWVSDLSPDLLQRAEQRMQTECPGRKVIFSQQDATLLDLPCERFDAVYGCSVLHHLQVGRALSETLRVLKPGGWCVFSEPNMLNPQIAVQKNVGFIKRRMGDTEDETAFFRSQVAQWLRTCGYQDVEVRHFDFLHPLTPSLLLAAVDGLGKLVERCPGIRALSGSLIFCGRKPMV